MNTQALLVPQRQVGGPRGVWDGTCTLRETRVNTQALLVPQRQVGGPHGVWDTGKRSLVAHLDSCLCSVSVSPSW